MIKAALIDMDGVLYDSMPKHAKAWAMLCRDLGFNIDEKEFFQYEGMTGEATIRMLLKRELGKEISHSEAKELYEIKARHFRQQESPEVMPGARQTLDFLKNRGIKCVLVTGSGQKSLIERLMTDFPDVFDRELMVTSANVRKGKPDPEPYIKGAELAGVDTSECIAIDNAPLGVQSAVASGAYTIAVNTGPIDPILLKEQHPAVVLESMIECADYLKRHIDNI